MWLLLLLLPLTDSSPALSCLCSQFCQINNQAICNRFNGTANAVCQDPDYATLLTFYDKIAINNLLK